MSDRLRKRLVVRLFGALAIAYSDGDKPRLAAGRQQALVALLATAPEMQRNRSWLIDKLWSDNTPERGRANLRQLLHATKQGFGTSFEEFFEVSLDCVGLKPGQVEVVGDRSEGDFLEGFDLAQEGFEEWLRERRLAPEPLPAKRAYSDFSDEPAVKPRLVVLPFGEITQSDQQGLGDALAHEITSGFARSQLVDAISHFSAQGFAGPLAPSPDRLQGLRLDYAITGQCRLVADKLTINITLFDMSDQTAIWSETLQESFHAFLNGEDALSAQVVGHSLRLIMAQSATSGLTRPLPELEAHRLMISGVSLMHSFEHHLFHRAQSQLLEVVRRCKSRSEPLAWLAQWYLLRVSQKWSPDPDADLRQASELVSTAENINPGCALSLAIDGNIHTVLKRDFDTAHNRFETALGINPSSAMISHLASVLETFRGNGDAAVKLTERGYSLSPFDPREPFFQTLSAGSYVAGGQYGKAVEMAEASIRRNPRHLSAHRCRVLGLQLGNREIEARSAARTLMEIDPDLTVAGYLSSHPTGQSKLGQRLAEALKEAGVPAQ